MDREKERRRIGERIAALRMDRKLTQQQLADMAGLAQSNLARVEAGRYSTRLDTLADIAEALQCEVQIVDTRPEKELGGWVLIEYKEKEGKFHVNPIVDGSLKNEPDTFGWSSIAVTHDRVASLFIYNADIRNADREKPMDTQEMKKEWKRFLLTFYSALITAKGVLAYIEHVRNSFNFTVAVTRLGNGHFSADKEENGWADADDYDPFSYNDANFF